MGCEAGVGGLHVPCCFGQVGWLGFCPERSFLQGLASSVAHRLAVRLFSLVGVLLALQDLQSVRVLVVEGHVRLCSLDHVVLPRVSGQVSCQVLLRKVFDCPHVRASLPAVRLGGPNSIQNVYGDYPVFFRC